MENPSEQVRNGISILKNNIRFESRRFHFQLVECLELIWCGNVDYRKTMYFNELLHRCTDNLSIARVMAYIPDLQEPINCIVIFCFLWLCFGSWLFTDHWISIDLLKHFPENEAKSI